MLTQCQTDGLKIKLQLSRSIQAVAATGDYVRVRYDVDLSYSNGTWPPPQRTNVSRTLMLHTLDDLASTVTAVIDKPSNSRAEAD